MTIVLQLQVATSGQNLRHAVEATIRSVKYPFDDSKMPVVELFQSVRRGLPTEAFW